MADPAPGAPIEWIQDEHHRRTAADLRAAATELRQQVAAIAERLRLLPAHDRPDVWQSPAADAGRRTRADAIRQLASPSAGALADTLDAARRLDARADAHEAAIPPAPAPPAAPPDVVGLLLDRWGTGAPGAG